MELDYLIHFETAKLAKNKGFDVSCFNAFLLNINTSEEHPERFSVVTKYLNTGEEEGIPVAENTYHMVHLHCTWKNSRFQPQILARPTQTALRRWLLEKHKIYIELIIDGWGNDDAITEENIGYRAFVWQIGKPRPHHNDDLGMTTYERILEVALEHALNLI
jgi:hypothetical protein